MIGHLGARVSALLDGQLSPAEAEEAWAHVYACHACRDLVEREGWIKTRLAGLSDGSGAVPSNLKGSLLSMPPGDRYLAASRGGVAHSRRLGAAVIGGGAVGAAMLGVIALGLTPGSNPPVDRRPPASRIDTTTSTPSGSESPPPVAVSSTDGVDGDVVPAWVRRIAH